VSMQLASQYINAFGNVAQKGTTVRPRVRERERERELREGWSESLLTRLRYLDRHERADAAHACLTVPSATHGVRSGGVPGLTVCVSRREQVLLPANTNDPAAMVGAALGIFKTLASSPPSPDQPAAAVEPPAPAAAASRPSSDGARAAAAAAAAAGGEKRLGYGDAKVANREIRFWHGVTEKGLE
jgi:uncharacterized protein YjlB